MSHEPLWHVGRNIDLSWTHFPGDGNIVAAFHSGNGQTFALDAFGQAILKLLELGPMTQSQLFSALVEKSLLPADQQGRQRLAQAVRQFHLNAIISRCWHSADRIAS